MRRGTPRLYGLSIITVFWHICAFALPPAQSGSPSPEEIVGIGDQHFADAILQGIITVGEFGDHSAADYP
jgi:hypothetical protein